MKTMNQISRLHRWVGGILLAGLVAVTLPQASATNLTLTSTSTFNPGFTLFTSETNPTIGNFDFSTNPALLSEDLTVADILHVVGVNITLTFFGLDTNPAGANPLLNPAGFDYNNISLMLGGMNTGIVLNGFSNNLDTLSFNAYMPTITNAADAGIVSYIQAHGGLLSVGLFDATNIPSNQFFTTGAVSSLSLQVTAVPFSPVQSLGFGLIAAFAAFRQFRRKGLAALIPGRS